MDPWEVLEYVGEMLVFIGVAGEVFAEWRAPHRVKLAKASSIVLIIGLALSLAALIRTNEYFNGTIADLNLKASQNEAEAARQNARASADEKEAAQLRKQTEDEALARASLEEDLAKEEPRETLLNWHRSDIAKALRPFAGQKFVVGDCFPKTDREGMQTSSFLMALLQNDAKWINELPSSEASGDCGGLGMDVSIQSDATKATRHNAKVLFSVLRNALKTDVFFEDTGEDMWPRLEKGQFDERAVLIIVFEQSYPRSPPHAGNKATKGK